MNIKSISNTQSFCGKEQYMKQFLVKAFDGNNATVRVHLNPAGNPTCMECYHHNDEGMLLGGFASGREPKLKLGEVATFLNKIRNLVPDIYEKFAEAMSR